MLDYQPMSENTMINITGVTKKFGDFTAVDNISLNVERGQIFAFLGPNGAGKTTSIKMLTTLLHPTSGTIRLAGHDPVTHPDEVRNAFGIVFQDASLDDELTAWENMEIHGVLYGVEKNARRKRSMELLELVELADRKDSLVKTFSGGMKRRLEIARGILHEPQVLFLDEPTIGLDPQTRNALWDHLRKLNQEHGLTIFFTTHYMEEVERAAQTVSIIDHGKIIETGTVASLKEKAGVASLEDAFLKVTGHQIRAEEASAQEGMRQMAKMWGRR